MANPEHLEILRQGVDAWNRWRPGPPLIQPDLSGADLSGADFSSADFYDVKLSHANLSGANLRGACLFDANLFYADLSGATLIKVDLSQASLISADLSNADLSNADLSNADLSAADLSGANLSHTNLSNANFLSTILFGATLTGANFADVRLAYTTFVYNDLSQVEGLEAVKHRAPSAIGIDTIYKSQGNIPEVFLRGCGVPEDFITYMRSLTAQPFQFYSCFISYSSKDQEFAERLHTDLQAKGVRVWFAPHDMPIGARIRPTIDESIRVYDKLLLVLSEHSVSSQWVEQEVETALAREREQEGKTVLFPVRIDDAVMEVKSGWPALLKNTRNVGDFTRWKEHDSYQRAFERLLRDLKAGA